MKKYIILAVWRLLMSTALFSQTIYSFDKYHSRLTFSAFHLGISSVEGIFRIFEVTLVSEKDDFSDAQITLVADVRSVSTEVEIRDNELREKWFETFKFPTMNFKSTSFRKVGDRDYKLTGNITIHGVTKPITFDVVYNGKAKNPFSQKYSHGFTITGKLDRNAFGIGKETLPTVSARIGVRSNVEFVID